MKLLIRNAIIVILVFCASFGAGIVSTHLFMQYTSVGKDIDLVGVSKGLKGERLNILIMGNDARPNENITRSDTLLVASIDPQLGKAVFLSIPRDTKWVSEKHGTQKINAALIYDGPEQSVKVVEDLLKIKIDYYVVINFDAFKQIIDTIGGVEIDVPQRMHKPSEKIDIDPGRQVLMGEDALGFVRYRDYLMGDEDRDKMQGVFLKALADKVLTPSFIPKIPGVLEAVFSNLKTDMPLEVMAAYATNAQYFNRESIIHQILPGYYENGYSGETLIWCFWIPDPKITPTIIDDLYAGKKFDSEESAPASADHYSGYSSGDDESSADEDKKPGENNSADGNTQDGQVDKPSAEDGDNAGNDVNENGTDGDSAENADSSNSSPGESDSGDSGDETDSQSGDQADRDQ